MNKSVKDIYEERVTRFTEELNVAQQSSSRISSMRLFVFTVTVVLVVWGGRANIPLMWSASFVVGVGIFVMLVIRHEALSKQITRLQSLLDINKKCIDRIEDRWNTFEDRGDDFIDEAHPYSSDLDIVGNSSLFQYIRTAHTLLGRKKLAARLTGEVPSCEQIKKYQEAVQELAPNIDFRHNLEATAMTIEDENPEAILSWVTTEATTTFSDAAKLFYRVFPYLSFAVLFVDFFYFRTFVVPALFYFVQILCFGLNYKRGMVLFTSFDRQKKALNVYADVIGHIEAEEFHAEHLLTQKKLLVNEQGVAASQAFTRMKSIIEKAELRFNPLVHFFVNCFTFWDLKCMISALQWKRENRAAVGEWLAVIAEFETLSSLALLAFDNPAWQMPEITEDITVEAVDVKHPLIPQSESVGNDITMNAESRVVIISGSNMSGKSTFLRTIATNMVLAYAGAPVAADSFRCGIFDILTSLRNNDTVAQKMSTFYTELLRIKEMLDSIRDGRQTFFLIDEIFNGTNSHDRIDGAFVVLRELHKANSLGMLSTHDLELCSLSSEEELQFTNYHFREEYKENKLTFDYRMYEGPSTTRNAIALMDIVGIPTHDLRNKRAATSCRVCGRLE